MSTRTDPYASIYADPTPPPTDATSTPEEQALGNDIPALPTVDPVSNSVETSKVGPILDPVDLGFQLANAIPHRAPPPEAKIYSYPIAVSVAAGRVEKVVTALETVLFSISGDTTTVASEEAKTALGKHLKSMADLCKKIIQTTPQSDEEVTETARDLWYLVKYTPNVLAFAMGIQKEELARPSEDNLFLPILANLAEAKDEIQNQMKFQKYQRNLSARERSEDMITVVILSFCISLIVGGPLLLTVDKPTFGLNLILPAITGAFFGLSMHMKFGNRPIETHPESHIPESIKEVMELAQQAAERNAAQR